MSQGFWEGAHLTILLGTVKHLLRGSQCKNYLQTPHPETLIHSTPATSPCQGGVDSPGEPLLSSDTIVEGTVSSAGVY